MNQVKIFRLFVVMSIVTAILGATLDLFVPSLIPDVLGDAYEVYAAGEEPTISRILMLVSLVLVLLIGTMVGTIGLLLFKSWGRRLSLWLSVLAILSYPFFGPVVCSCWANMLIETSMMLWGAALAMAYFAEIKVIFENNGANNAMPSTREDVRA